MIQPFADAPLPFAARKHRLALLLLSAVLLASGPALAQAPDSERSPAPASAAETVPTGNAGTPGLSTAPAASEPAARETAAAVEPARLPRDLSPWGMFLAADWVVKAVMIGLAFASVVTWTVWLAKTIELFSLRSQARRDIATLGRARSTTEAAQHLGNRAGAVPELLRSAILEFQLSAGARGGEGVKERVTSRLERIEASHGRRAAFGTGVLATIGSTGPFVGLFGTVWGIMNSFIGISHSQTTNLAVVAPGIAEALLATALGLVAAIPAVVIYNTSARAITAYRALLADAGAEVMRLVSRDLDRAMMERGNPLSAAAE